MKYDILFYLAQKTGYCEKCLKKAMSQIGFSANRIISSTTPVDLGNHVCDSLRLCNVVIIVGGLKSQCDDNLSTVLSRAVSNSGLTLSNMRKLTGKNSDDGYIVKYKNQVILALPDSPEEIKTMLDSKLLNYIGNIYK